MSQQMISYISVVFQITNRLNSKSEKVTLYVEVIDLFNLCDINSKWKRNVIGIRIFSVLIQNTL